jgi:hypothetical protein
VDLGYYDMDGEDVRKMVAEPYANGDEFLLGGRRIDPNQIEVIRIYKTEESVEEMMKGLLLRYRDKGFCMNVMVERIRKGEIGQDVTGEFISSLPRVQKTVPKPQRPEPSSFDLMNAASFLGLDTNWSSATCALQLQEVAVILVAERKEIKLDKQNIERLLNRKVQETSFNDQYEAFSVEAKRLFNIEMPILAMHLRRMRVNVLHEGYNPTPEEKDSIVRFTIGLLQKLKDMYESEGKREERKVSEKGKEEAERITSEKFAQLEREVETLKEKEDRRP